MQLGAVLGLDRPEFGCAVPGQEGCIGMLGIQRVLLDPGQPLAADVGADVPAFCKYFKVQAVPDIPAKDYQRALDALEKKRKGK